ncbi:MAG: hypothetical protein Q9186_006101 [Xanthomendoza sp. 1 TL-2023]
MVHGFYVLMGGFAISIPKHLPESEQFVPSWARGVWFITGTVLVHLLEFDKDSIPLLTEEEIKSGSKANGLAKALVCAQVRTRFMRNSILHCEADLFHSSHSGLKAEAYWWGGIEFGGSKRRFPPFSDSAETPEHQSDIDGPPASSTFGPGEVVPGTQIKLQSTISSTGSEVTLALPRVSLTKQDINRWEMALRAAEIQGTVRINRRYTTYESTNKGFRRRCPDMPDVRDVIGNLQIALGFSAAAMIYGGLHALAWFAHFNSPIEQMLWRLSACVVMGGIPICFTIAQAWDYLDTFTIPLWIENILLFICRLAVLLLGIAYALARLYLVIESFIQLSHLPAGVYDQPEWSSYFPHIS